MTAPLPPGSPYPPRPPFNAYAIIAIIVASFVLPPLGIYFGHVAKKQIAQTDALTPASITPSSSKSE